MFYEEKVDWFQKRFKTNCYVYYPTEKDKKENPRAKIAPEKFRKLYNKNQALKHERIYKQIMKIKKEK